MAMMTGEISARLGDAEYTLLLSMRGVSKLQAEFGDDFLQQLQSANDKLPPMDLCLRVVEIALDRHHKGADIAGIADDLLTADLGLVRRIFEATFPSDEAPEGEDTEAKK